MVPFFAPRVNVSRPVCHLPLCLTPPRLSLHHSLVVQNLLRLRMGLSCLNAPWRTTSFTPVPCCPGGLALWRETGVGNHEDWLPPVPVHRLDSAPQPEAGNWWLLSDGSEPCLLEQTCHLGWVCTQHAALLFLWSSPFQCSYRYPQFPEVEPEVGVSSAQELIFRCRWIWSGACQLLLQSVCPALCLVTWFSCQSLPVSLSILCLAFQLLFLVFIPSWFLILSCHSSFAFASLDLFTFADGLPVYRTWT